MTKEQYEDVKSFAHQLNAKRLQVPDAQLLDQCQKHLDDLVAELADNFEEHPEQPEESGEATGFLRKPEPEPKPQPEPPPFQSEPKHEVRHHQVEHKRPSPRKTRR